MLSLSLGLGLGSTENGGFTPSSIPGLKQWVEAGRFTGFNDGGAIATPTESSGSGLNVTASGTSKPLYKTNIVNGNPAMLFDGVDDFFTSDSYTLGTLVIAAYTADFGFYRGLMAGVANIQGDVYLTGDGGTTNTWYSAIRASAAGSIRKNGATYAFDNVLSQWLVMSIRDSSPQAEAWQFGWDRNRTPMNSTVWNGYIYGWAAYDTSLTTAQLNQVERYFGSKVAVTVA